MAAAVDLLAELRRQEEQVRTLRAAYAATMARDGATFWIAEAASTMRKKNERLLVDVASRLRVSEPKISRFERHKSLPPDLDDVIGAYAKELEIEPIEIWQRALELWAAGDAAKPAEEGLVTSLGAPLLDEVESRTKPVPGQSSSRRAASRRKPA